MTAAVLTLCVMVVPVSAQTIATRYRLDIERQTLDEAIKDFASQTGLQIARLSAAIDGNQLIGPVSGEMSVAEALELLLTVNGLTYRIVNDRTIAVMKLGATAGSYTSTAVPSPHAGRRRTAERFAGDATLRLAGLRMASEAQSDSAASGGGRPAASYSAGNAERSRGVLQEVVVTARKRAERLQDIPDSVTVFTADMIDDIGITSYQDFVDLTSNVSMFRHSKPGVSVLTVRGISTAQGGEAPVTVVVDGVQAPALDFIDQDLFNVESIQILKGPQGALYGRGAIAGAILINTRQPASEFEHWGKLRYGNGPNARVSAGLSGPLGSDQLLFGLSGSHVDSDGLIPDTAQQDDADFVHETSVAMHLKYRPNDALTVHARGKRVDGTSGGTLVEIVTDAGYRDFTIHPSRDLRITDSRTIDDWSLAVEYETGAGVWHSVSAYNRSRSIFFGDADFGPLDIAQQFSEVNIDAFNHDLRFASRSDQRLRWILGAFYQTRSTHNYLLVDSTPTTVILPPGLVLAASDQLDDSDIWAVYGQINYDIRDTLELTLALRYDEDRRSSEDRLVPGSGATDAFSLLQPKLSLARRWNKDFMTYVTYGRGFRSGGFNALRDSQQSPAVARRYPKEISDSLEVGAKSSLFSNHLTLNVAAFRITFENQQFFFVDIQNVSRSIVSFVETEISGLEVEAVARPVRGLELIASLGVTDASIDDFDGTGRFDGNRSPLSYRSTLNLSAQYSGSLSSRVSWSGRVDYQRRGRIFFSPSNEHEFPPSEFVNARVTLQRDRWSIGAFVDNLTDEVVATMFSPDVFVPGVNGRFRNQPRTYGVEAGYRF